MTLSFDLHLPTTIPFKKFSSLAFSRILYRVSITIINKSRDKGSSYLKPLEVLKKYFYLLLTNTGKLAYKPASIPTDPNHIMELVEEDTLVDN